MAEDKDRAVWRKIVKLYDDKCFYCDGRFSPFKQNAICTLDRIIPRSRGGSQYFWNIVPACYKCNHFKSNHSLAFCAVKYGLDLEFIQKKYYKVTSILLKDFYYSKFQCPNPVTGFGRIILEEKIASEISKVIYNLKGISELESVPACHI